MKRSNPYKRQKYRYEPRERPSRVGKVGRKKKWKVYVRDQFKCIDCPFTMDEEIVHDLVFHPERISDSIDHFLTIDHLIPKSKGGGNEIWNLGTMCNKCNNEKQNLVIEHHVEIAMEQRKEYMMRARKNK